MKFETVEARDAYLADLRRALLEYDKAWGRRPPQGYRVPVYRAAWSEVAAEYYDSSAADVIARNVAHAWRLGVTPAQFDAARPEKSCTPEEMGIIANNRRANEAAWVGWVAAA